MRAKDIKVGEFYRLKSAPEYGYIRPILIIPKKSKTVGFESIPEEISKLPYITVKCEHTLRKSDMFGLIRYFKPVDIIKDGE